MNVSKKRPRRHVGQRVSGWALFGFGVVMLVLNFVSEFGPPVMPGGHEEYYFILGGVLAGVGAWWTGVLD